MKSHHNMKLAGLVLVAGTIVALGQLNCSWNIQSTGTCGTPVPCLSRSPPPGYCYNYGPCPTGSQCVKSVTQAPYLLCSNVGFQPTCIQTLLGLSVKRCIVSYRVFRSLTKYHSNCSGTCSIVNVTFVPQTDRLVRLSTTVTITLMDKGAAQIVVRHPSGCRRIYEKVQPLLCFWRGTGLRPDGQAMKTAGLL